MILKAETSLIEKKKNKNIFLRSGDEKNLFLGGVCVLRKIITRQKKEMM